MPGAFLPLGPRLASRVWFLSYNVARMAYKKRLLSPGEEVVKEFRPHWIMLVLPIALAVIVVAGMVVATLTLAGNITWWVIIGLVLVWLLLTIKRWLDWLTTQYVVTNERVIFRVGILAKRGKEIPLEVINDVAFNQSVLERMVRSGDLMIESAGEFGQSRFTDIPDPEGLQSLIYQLREVRAVSLENSNRSVGTEIETLARLRDQGVLSAEEFEAQKRRLLQGP